MGAEMIGRLAVARLVEAEPAWAHRCQPAAPLTGYALISREAERCRVTLYIENGRMLEDRSGASGFYYEGWLVGSAGPVSLGAFNLGPEGQGGATRLLEAGQVQSDRAALVRVTAEPFGGSVAGAITVLEGPLVWLAEAPAEAPVPQPEVEEPAAQLTEAEPGWAEPAARVLVPSLVVPAESQAESPEIAGGSEEIAGGSPEIAGGSEEIAGGSAESIGGSVRQANPLTPTIHLVQRHPMAPRAAGTAILNPRQGGLTLMLRGLPSPTAMGRDRSTDRPFNSYRVWLLNQQSHSRTAVGFCERAWGENFRFQGEGLPLTRYDTILVTVEDRTATGAGHASPQVLMGSFSL